MDFIYYFTLGVVVEVIIMAYLNGVLQYLCGKMLGLRVLKSHIFNMDIRRMGDKLQYKKANFRLGYHVSMWDEKMDEKKSTLYLGLCMLVYVILVVIVWLVLWPQYGFVNTIPGYFWSGICVSLLLRFLFQLIAMFWRSTRENTLKTILNKNIDAMKAGTDYEMLNLPFEQIKKKKDIPPERDLSRVDRILCCLLYFYQQVALNDMEALDNCVGEIERNLPAKFYTSDTIAYAMLVFYYSYYKRIPEVAKSYYQVVKTHMENETDPNGYRHLAYYRYYVCQDTDGAREALRLGMAGLKDCAKYHYTQAEVKMETKLMAQLADIINL